MMTTFHTWISNLTPCYMLISFGLLGAYFFRKQFLISLLSLEFVILGLFLSVALTISLIGQSPSTSLYILVLGACEASLGLSLLVSLTRVSGSDMLSLISLIKC